MYKLALDLARVHRKGRDNANTSNANITTTNEPTAATATTTNILLSMETELKAGPEWSRSGPAERRAWTIVHSLMDLLATGMASNLKARIAEPPPGGARYSIVPCFSSTVRFLPSRDLRGVVLA